MGTGRTLIVHCERPRTANVETAMPPRMVQGSAQVWFATLKELQGRMDRYGTLLDEDELIRAKRYRFDSDRERYILGHGLLREVLGKQLHARPKELVLRRGEFGKPFLEGHPVHFNLSDTKDAVLVALAQWPIGADIETMNRNTDHERVADHYFTKPEVESIKAAPDGKRRFLELWTRKEAVLKACGVGLMDDLHSLNVGEAFNEMTIKHPDFVRLAGAQYHVRTAYVGRDHLVSLASETPFKEWHLLPA